MIRERFGAWSLSPCPFYLWASDDDFVYNLYLNLFSITNCVKIVLILSLICEHINIFYIFASRKIGGR